MAFFKKIIDDHNFSDLVHFNGEIFAIGKYETAIGEARGMLCKLNSSGNILFFKSYSIDNTETSFRNIILVNDGLSSAVDVIVSGAYGANLDKSFVCRISTQTGNIIWNKCYTGFRLGSNTHYSTLAKLNSSEFLFVNRDNSANKYHIHKVSNSGGSVLSKNMEVQYFGGISISPDGQRIVFVRALQLFVLNESLSILSYSAVIGVTYITYTAFLNNTEFIAAGNANTGWLHLMKFNVNSLGSISSIATKKIENVDHAAYQQRFFVDSNHFYFSIADSVIGVPGENVFSSSIGKFDHNLNLVWSKRFDTSLSNKVDINYRPKLYINDVDNDGDLVGILKSVDKGFLFTSDDSLDTCITVLKILNITNDSLNISHQSKTNSTVTVLTPSLSTTVGNISTQTEDVCETPVQTVDLTLSTIEAADTSIPADGTSQTDITVQLRDENGFNITTGNPYSISITTNAGTLTNPNGQTDNEGKYVTELQSSNTPEFALLEYSVGTVGNGQDTEVVEFTAIGITIPIDDDTVIQSPHIYLQAAGSDGTDSTKGRHLRWSFRKALGEKHLPKGNNAGTAVNFNKPNDFVTIYRAPYSKHTFELNLQQSTPTVVDHSNYLWIYRISGKEFYMYFENTAKYDQVQATINPLLNAWGFLNSYGDEIIEIENKKELFFAVKFQASGGFVDPPPYVQFETLSVSENSNIANKVVSNRKVYEGGGLSNNWQVCENGRSIRYKTNDTIVSKVTFELVGDFIVETNNGIGWEKLGDFALSLNNTEVYKQLEPNAGDVHGVWQRFNDDAFVNINNYQDKWDGTPEPGDRTIKQVVNTYIQLSDNASNPTALEEIPLGNDPNDPNDVMEVSNLDLLNLAANDYHVARLLGLGMLDIDEPGEIEIESKEGTETIYVDLDPNYVYVAEYFTTADLEDGQGERDVHHLFMSLPSSNDDFRLPIPVNLDELIPGLYLGGSNGEPSPITDEDGYTHDGLSRYISLYAEQIPEDPYNEPFFASSEEINLSTITNPVFGGLEHKINDEDWDKPELPNDPEYQNAVPAGEDTHNETRFILLPEPLQSYYIHRQTSPGLHHYAAYGINWFSRATLSNTIISINTQFRPANPLRPPSTTNALLIRQEAPLLLTSQEEQDRLAAISGDDKTLIRLTYNYHTLQELKDYPVPIDSDISNEDLETDPNSLYPDDDEIFAEEIEIFFRNEIPNNVIGKALTVTDHGTYEILSVITTGDYVVASTGETISPVIPPGSEDNFVGGVFVLENEKYIIHEVTQGVSGPDITVYKKQISDSIVGGGNPTNEGGYPIDLPITDGSFPTIGDGVELIAPEIAGDGYFMAVENMQTPDNWGTPNPLSFKVNIGDTWDVHREVIELDNGDGTSVRHLEKSRGIWDDAQITEVNEPDGSFLGMYKIEFENKVLGQHSQYASDDVSAEWFRGIARVFTQSAVSGSVPSATRRVLSVLKLENVGTANKLIIYAQDPGYDPNDPNYDAIETGSGVSVNFYPGYKIYLYEDTPFGIDESNILPAEGEGMRYSIFGFRSSDTDDDYLSRISIPALMFAQEIIQPLPPELPEGPLYATRPDFFGRSTYTLTTKYAHKPHAVLFYRSNDEALLNSLYEKSTVLQIRESLETLGGNNEEYLTNRWQNFLDFDQLGIDGNYSIYPPPGVSPDGYKFPNPDKQTFFDWANSILGELGQPLITDSPGSLAAGDPKILHFVRGIIYNAFVPLTELPVIYQYIEDENYKPIDKQQVVRDRNGNVLPPGHEDFEMAPMMKTIGTSPHETLFTDFKLDGTSNNLYFYGVKELGTQLKMSGFSPFLGPIKLVNTNAPETPEIKRIIPVLGNESLGSDPMVQIEVNAFPAVQNIKKLTIYRAGSMIEAQSVHAMDMVKVVDLESENLLDEAVWTVKDDFSDLSEVPYGDPLYYRITVSREVEYADKDGNILTEYAPSKASKISASVMVESSAPQSPALRFMSTAPVDDMIEQVSLVWDKMAYNAKYHVYKMNDQGNWYKIFSKQLNDNEIQLSLGDTDLQDSTLKLLNEDGETVYHHFKVITENTAGMLSQEEKLLSIFNSDVWTEV